MEKTKFCVNCMAKFVLEKSGKSYNRYSLSGKLRRDETSTAFALQELLGLETITPKPARSEESEYLCGICYTALCNAYIYNSAQVEAHNALESRMKEGGYVSLKRQRNTNSPCKTFKKLKSQKATDTVFHESADISHQEKSYGQRTTAISKLFNNSEYCRGVRKLAKKAVGRKALRGYFCSVIKKEMIRLVQLKEHPLHQKTDLLESIEAFDWDVALKATEKEAPFLMSLLRVAMKATKTEIPNSIFGSVLSIILNQRAPRKFRFLQDRNSIQLGREGCKKQTISAFNKLGLCWSSSTTKTVLEQVKVNRNCDKEGMQAEVEIEMEGLSPGDASTASAPATVVAAPSTTQQGEEEWNEDGSENSASTPSKESSDDEAILTPADASLLNKLVHSKLITNNNDLEVLRKDANSPLYYAQSFEALNLKPELLKGVSDMGFNAPSRIQEIALPTLLADPPQNMIAQSQSGTGKTAAFVLTMLSRLDASKKYPQCLCIAPTYDLALQLGQVTKQMAKNMPDVTIKYAVRGQRLQQGIKLSEQIVIGTPGTLLDWATKLKFFDLKKVDVFVLDEADVMIDTQGHQDQSLRIQRGLRKDCQMLLFSATYDVSVMKFAQAIVPNPVTIQLRREEDSLNNIKQFYVTCNNQQDKFEALSNIYGTISIGQSMIFCHTRKTANWLVEKMTEEGHAVALLSGELTVEQRAAVIQRFRDGKEKVLITTNVTARGIDVEQVAVVVNFDLPVDTKGQADCETYLHRIGRTGRFGKNGLAINMIDSDKSMRVLESIEQHFARKILKLDAEDKEEIEKIGT